MSQISPDSASTLAGQLRALRTEVGATQKEVAEALGLGISSISAYEKGAPLTDARLGDYAAFVAVRQSRGAIKVTAKTELTDAERSIKLKLLHDLRSLRNAPEEETTPDLWTFPRGDPIMLVVGQLQGMDHPYGSSRDPNFTELLSCADLDALFELHGHIRMRNPASEVKFTRSDRLTESDQLARHLVIIGGPGLNESLQQIFDGTALPISQGAHENVTDGEVFYVPDSEPELPEFSERGTRRLTGDIGLFVRLTNPFNSARTLSWCSGVYSRGVLGAVRMLTDASLRDQNGKYLAARFAHMKQFAVLVKVPVMFGRALTPDLQNDEMRLYEWRGTESSRSAQSGGNSGDMQ
jgi:transcriptional regulator with XRE-family HTH domain